MNMQLAAYQFDAVRFAIEKLGFHPDPRQAEVLRLSTRRGILNCTRQWGKWGQVHHLQRHFPFRNRSLSSSPPTERQSAELVRKCRQLLGFSADPDSNALARRALRRQVRRSERYASGDS